MKLRSLHDRVVIRHNEEETKTTNGVVLSGPTAGKSGRGEVIVVDTDRILDNGEVRAPAVKVGDEMVFGPYSGSSAIEVDDEELLMVGESEILAALGD